MAAVAQHGGGIRQGRQAAVAYEGQAVVAGRREGGEIVVR
eukprot:ctg_4203.g651